MHLILLAAAGVGFAVGLDWRGGRLFGYNVREGGDGIADVGGIQGRVSFSLMRFRVFGRPCAVQQRLAHVLFISLRDRPGSLGLQ